ncbi:MAG: Arc family DNA-binding protein [Candidatus Riflebacteria bacterium]|nr:Arc family DNA-binding protein [Candidatus Riflebacteria bacterium]
MATITLKSVPGFLHSELKKQAERNRRSLNNEIITTLERALGLTPCRIDELIEKARNLRKTLKVHLTEEMLYEFKNEGRK